MARERETGWGGGGAVVNWWGGGPLSHGYGVPDEGLVSRSHGYAQTDTAYADISTRRSQVGEASKYATGELS